MDGGKTTPKRPEQDPAAPVEAQNGAPNGKAGRQDLPRVSSAGKAHRDAEYRRHRLLRLAELVAEVRDSLGRVQAETNHLLLTEQLRRLSVEEMARARSARWESERLRHELQRLHEEFEQLRAERNPG